MNLLVLVLAWTLGPAQTPPQAPAPCRDRPLVDGELPIASGQVNTVTPTMFKVGTMTLAARLDSDAYRELLLFAREEIAIRVSLRLVDDTSDPPATSVFERTGRLEDLGLLSGKTLRPALVRLDEVELMVYGNRCLAQQIVKWAGKRVQLIARYDRGSSEEVDGQPTVRP